MTLRAGGHSYQVVEGWAKLPTGWAFNDAAGVAVDSKDRVYVFSRSEHPVAIFDREGKLLTSWGKGVFTIPHSVKIDRHDALYLADTGDQTVRKMTSEGQVVMTLGRKNRPSDTGAEGLDFRTVKRASGPFNGPTDIAFGPSGEIFVSDGYGNARIHRFSRDGRLIESRGEPGDGPGQFRLPHGACFDNKGRLYVADRENSRIQVFGEAGELLDEWKDVRRPTSVLVDGEGLIYVAELGYLSGLFPGMTTPADREPLPRLTFRSSDGEILAEWGGKDRCRPGNFFAPHSIAVDSRGDIYIGEVAATTGAPEGCHTLQKFVRDG